MDVVVVAFGSCVVTSVVYLLAFFLNNVFPQFKPATDPIDLCQLVCCSPFALATTYALRLGVRGSTAETYLVAMWCFSQLVQGTIMVAKFDLGVVAFVVFVTLTWATLTPDFARDAALLLAYFSLARSFLKSRPRVERVAFVVEGASLFLLGMRHSSRDDVNGATVAGVVATYWAYSGGFLRNRWTAMFHRGRRPSRDRRRDEIIERLTRPRFDSNDKSEYARFFPDEEEEEEHKKE